MMILLPEAETSSPYELSYRSLNLLLEQTIVGAGGDGPHQLHLGSLGGAVNFKATYVNPLGTDDEVYKVKKLNMRLFWCGVAFGCLRVSFLLC